VRLFIGGAGCHGLGSGKTVARYKKPLQLQHFK